jgi:hypothetical protein
MNNKSSETAYSYNNREKILNRPPQKNSKDFESRENKIASVILYIALFGIFLALMLLLF